MEMQNTLERGFEFLNAIDLLWKVLLHAAQQNPPMEIPHEAKDLLLIGKTAVLAGTAGRQGGRMHLFPVWALTPTSPRTYPYKCFWTQ